MEGKYKGSFTEGPEYENVWSFGANCENVDVGAIIQATGARPYDASKLQHLGYGKSDDVITSRDLEEILKESFDDEETDSTRSS